MKKQIFETENKMQEWLSKELNQNDCFRDLISNAEKVEDSSSTSLVKNRILNSYKHCLESFGLITIIAENENISLKEGDTLKPDFLLYAPETESIVVVELKNLVSPSRQAGTEVSAYASEIKSYIPFISDGDIINVIVSSVWTALLRHYIFHEIFWLNRNIICLEPIEIDGEIKLQIKPASFLIDNNISLKLSHQHLGGYQICLYDYNLYKDRTNRTRLDSFVEQMKTAIAAMSSKGNSQKNHGFAFLWKDNWEVSLAPYSITVLNFAPFKSLERFFHDDDFKPNEITEKFIDIITDYGPEGHGNSLDEIYNNGEKFLGNFCEPRREGFTTWDNLKTVMISRGSLMSFHSWGIFSELFSDKLYKEYSKGNNQISFIDPNLGLQLIDELIDPKYEFIDLSNYNSDGNNIC